MMRTTMTPERYRTYLELRAQGLSQAKIAARLGIPRTVISYYEALPAADRNALRVDSSTMRFRAQLENFVEDAYRVIGYPEAMCALTDEHKLAIERFALTVMSWPWMKYRRFYLEMECAMAVQVAADERP